MAFYFKINQHQAGDTYQFEEGGLFYDYAPGLVAEQDSVAAVFTTTRTGNAFQPLTEYRVWKERPTEFRDCFTFLLPASGGVTEGEKYSLSGDSAALTWNDVLRNGDWTNITPSAPNLVLTDVPVVDNTGEFFTRVATPNGYKFAFASLNPTPPAWRFIRSYTQRAINSVAPSWRLVSSWTQQAVGTPAPPAAPSEVRVFRIAGTMNAKLIWKDNAYNETSYVVEESTNGTTWTSLISLEAGVTVLPLNGLALNTYRYYRVWAVNDVGESAKVVSNQLRIINYSVVYGQYPPGASPVRTRQLLANSIDVSPGTGNIGVLITLPGGSDPDANDFDKVTVDVVFPGGTHHKLTSSLSGDGPYFSDALPDGATLPAGQYTALITATLFDQAILSDSLSFSLSAPQTAPAAPSNLSVRRNPSLTGAVLTYTDNSDNEQSFEISLKRPGESSFSPVTTVLANQTSVTVSINPLPDETQFQVVARNAAGISSPATATLAATANPIQVDRVRARVIRDVPTSAGLFLEIGTNINNQPVDIQLTDASGAALGNWQGPNYGSGSPGALGDDGSYVHTIPFNANTLAQTTLYFRVRPSNNQSAIKGIYAATYGGSVSYNWQELTPTS